MADEHEETHTLRRPIRAPFVWAPTEDEARVLDRLIDNEAALNRLALIEPDITARAKRDTAFALVGEITKKAAAWIAGMIGCLFLLSELLTRIAK